MANQDFLTTMTAGLAEHATNELDELIIDLVNSASPEWIARWMHGGTGERLMFAREYDVLGALDAAIEGRWASEA